MMLLRIAEEFTVRTKNVWGNRYKTAAAIPSTGAITRTRVAPPRKRISAMAAITNANRGKNITTKPIFLSISTYFAHAGPKHFAASA